MAPKGLLHMSLLYLTCKLKIHTLCPLPWLQARMMGVFAAHCMAGVQEQTGVAMAFELFTHATRFMGHKVVLLGLYNGQRLEAEDPRDVVTYSRVTEVGGSREVGGMIGWWCELLGRGVSKM